MRRDDDRVTQPSLIPEDEMSESGAKRSSDIKMAKIYFDTNQLYYIRRIADEAEGWDYGNYLWAYKLFPNNPLLVQDIRALCYIVAFQYEWGLDFYSSDASFSELYRSAGKRAQATRDAWILFSEGLQEDQTLHRVPFLPDRSVSSRLSLDFIDDLADRVVLRHFASEGDGVFLTSDDDILRHKDRLVEMNLLIMRPNEWINEFLGHVRGDEDAVDWTERVLFSIGKSSE